jgi:hypothetical protein
MLELSSTAIVVSNEDTVVKFRKNRNRNPQPQPHDPWCIILSQERLDIFTNHGRMRLKRNTKYHVCFSFGMRCTGQISLYRNFRGYRKPFVISKFTQKSREMAKSPQITICRREINLYTACS